MDETEAQKFKTHTRIIGLLSVCKEEIDVPLFYSISALCKAIKVQSPPLPQFYSALINAGYKVSGSHCEGNAFKTNAPNDVIWDIMRCWRLLHKPQKDLEKLQESSPTYNLLLKDPVIKADFTVVPEAKLNSSKVPRYIKNPGQGPKSKATGKKRSNSSSIDPESAPKRPKLSENEVL
jgi:tRNA (guanine26-N2/guanine27-N2)-dimethyltransferase